MKVKVLTLRWSDETGGLDDRELEAFSEGRMVLEVSEHFFIHDKQPTLVLTLSYRDESPEDGGKERRHPQRDAAVRPDPRQGLDPTERARYDLLRKWRNDIAKREGKPPYLFLTNRQAVELAKKPPASLADLRAVQGLGESRVDAFGEELLALFSALPGEGVAAPEAPADAQ